MSTKPSILKTTTVSHGEPQSSRDARRQLHIARELADVTWRIAVPVLGLSLLGIWADKSWGTKPWLTLAGSVLGFGIAAALVNLQIKRVTKEEKQS